MVPYYMQQLSKVRQITRTCAQYNGMGRTSSIHVDDVDEDENLLRLHDGTDIDDLSNKEESVVKLFSVNCYCCLKSNV